MLNPHDRNPAEAVQSAITKAFIQVSYLESSRDAPTGA